MATPQTCPTDSGLPRRHADHALARAVVYDQLAAGFQPPTAESLARLDAAGAQGLLEAAAAHLRGLDAHADLVIRLTLLPSRLARVRDLVEGLADDLDSRRRARVSTVTDVLTGTTRVGVADPGARVPELAGAVKRLREAAEAEGGSVRVSSGPAELIRLVGAWGGAGAVQRLSGGMRNAFDPKGVLPWERFAS